jgi:hypothetical protein
MKCLAWLALFTSMVAVAQKPSTPKALFYMTETPASVNSFLEHASRIDILVPAWYQMDADGLVTGASDPRVLNAAREHHVPVPLKSATVLSKKRICRASAPGCWARKILTSGSCCRSIGNYHAHI